MGSEMCIRDRLCRQYVGEVPAHGTKQTAHSCRNHLHSTSISPRRSTSPKSAAAFVRGRCSIPRVNHEKYHGRQTKPSLCETRHTLWPRQDLAARTFRGPRIIGSGHNNRRRTEANTRRISTEIDQFKIEGANFTFEPHEVE